MFYRHKANLPKTILPNTALIGWELVGPSDDLSYACYEATIEYNRTVPLSSLPSRSDFCHIYFCMTGQGTCTFNDGEKHAVETRHLVALSGKESCNLTVSSQDGMRLFIVYCPHNSDEDSTSKHRVIRSVEEITGTERDNDFGCGHSRRLLLKCDGFPLAFNFTNVNPGALAKLQYRNHEETCYYYTGGKITYRFDNETVESQVESSKDEANGTLICIDGHEKHTVDRSDITDGKDAESICIFTPPLIGKEGHSLSPDGYSSYDLLD